MLWCFSTIAEWYAISLPQLGGFGGYLIHSKLRDVHRPTEVHRHLYNLSMHYSKEDERFFTSPNSGVSELVAEYRSVSWPQRPVLGSTVVVRLYAPD